MTRGEARTIALEELNKVLTSNCTPPQHNLPVLLVGSPVTIAERLTAAAMAAHVWAGIEWPVITGGPLVEALRERCVRCQAPLARDSGSRLCIECYHDPRVPHAAPLPPTAPLEEQEAPDTRRAKCEHPKMTGIMRVVPVPCPDCGRPVF